ncbi:MAG: hypothetical protein R3A10_04335 [Caldilineaceae bacterium]
MALDYVYSGISVGNDDDELLLLAPGDREVDRVVWGRQQCRRGVRTQHAAATRWRGLGRFHHPLARFCRRHGHAGDGILAPAQATPTPLPGRNPDPIVPSTPTPAPTVVWTGPVPPVYISEVLANPGAVSDTDGEVD